MGSYIGPCTSFDVDRWQHERRKLLGHYEDSMYNFFFSDTKLMTENA